MSGHEEANSHLCHAGVVELLADLGEAQDAPEVLGREAMRPEGDDIVFQLGRAHHLGENELGSLRSGWHFRLSPLFFIVSKERAARNYSVKVKKTGLFHIILYFWTYGA